MKARGGVKKDDVMAGEGEGKGKSLKFERKTIEINVR